MGHKGLFNGACHWNFRYSRLRAGGRSGRTLEDIARTIVDRGIRYRVKNSLPGHPDIVFNGKKITVFVDGCFWHGCPVHSNKPKSNRDYWNKKIQGNMDRDKKVVKHLKGNGWTVLRFWEHEVMKDLDKVIQVIEIRLS